METIETVFTCSKDALYEGCDQLAINLTEELATLAGFKAKYTSTFVTDFKQQIKVARELPDEEQRTTEHELKRIELTGLTDGQIKPALGSLRLYIRDAYENADVRRVKLDDAGFTLYESAMNYNWEKLRTLMQRALTFVTDNSADLEANDNMPAGFIATLTSLKNNVDGKVPAFLNVKENAPQGTQAKNIASNELYLAAVGICEDGQHVFANDPAKRKQFVWDAIQEIVTPAGGAGLKFDVKEAGSNLPLNGVQVNLQPEGEPVLTVTTDEEGKGAFTNLKAGSCKVTILLTGYVTRQVELELSTGVTSYKHWELTANQ